MVVRMRHTSGHTRNRRSHHALKMKQLQACKDCGKLALSHTVCASCGMYKGKQVIKIKTKAKA